MDHRIWVGVVKQNFNRKKENQVNEPYFIHDIHHPIYIYIYAILFLVRERGGGQLLK